MKIGQSYLNSPERRALDIASASAMMPGCLPLALASAALLGIELRSPNVLFRQERRGFRGIAIDVMKLRTLPQSNDESITTYGTRDPRAGKIGTFVRRYGFDEIPQLVNVLNGNMTMVGMRPSIEKDIEKYADADPLLFDEWEEAYNSNRPAILGQSQLLRHADEVMTSKNIAESMRLDLEYVETASLVTDLRLITSIPWKLVRENLRTEHVPVAA